MTKQQDDRDLHTLVTLASLTTLIGVPIGLVALAIGGHSLFGAWNTSQAEVSALVACAGLGVPAVLWVACGLIGAPGRAPDHSDSDWHAP